MPGSGVELHLLALLLRHSTGDERFMHIQVNVGKRLDVQATLPSLVLAEPCEELVAIDRRIQTVNQAVNADIALPPTKPTMHESPSRPLAYL